MRLTALDGQTFGFDPGATCLEFAHTGGEGFRAVWETLHTPADLSTWLQAYLGAEPAPVGGTDLAAARRLRNAIWHCADAVVAGDPLPADAVADINAAAARPPVVPRIDDHHRQALALPVTTPQVLSTLARDAVDLFAGPRAGRLRRCAGTNCFLVFVDTSRPGRRRWCSMERCGNRAKVAAFRSRHTEEPS